MKKKPSYSQQYSIDVGDRFVIAGTNYAGKVPNTIDENGISVKTKGIPFVNLDKLDLT